MTSVMTLWSEQWCALRWVVNMNSGHRPKLSHLVSVFGLSERLIQKVKWPSVKQTAASKHCETVSCHDISTRVMMGERSDGGWQHLTDAKAPTKYCYLDPAPTWLVKRLLPVLAETLAKICNASFHEGIFHYLSSKLEGSRRPPTVAETDAWSWRCELIPTDIQFKLFVKGHRARRSSQT